VVVKAITPLFTCDQMNSIVNIDYFVQMVVVNWQKTGKEMPLQGLFKDDIMLS